MSGSMRKTKTKERNMQCYKRETQFKLERSKGNTNWPLLLLTTELISCGL